MAPGPSKEIGIERTVEEDAQAALLKDDAETTAKLSTSTNDGMITVFYSFIKKLVTVGIIYCVGYYGLSFAWLFSK